MIDVKKVLTNHNKQIKSEASGEYRLDCWFCNPLDTNGHLYMRSDEGVFHCFKCGTKGNLSTLGWIDGDVRRKILSSTMIFYEDVFKNSEMVKYWFDRGFTQATLDQFHIGYGRIGLSEHLGEQYDPKIFLELELFTKTGQEFFAGVYVIPYFDVNGNVIAFKGRKTQFGKGPKYLGMRNESHRLFNVHSLCAKNKVVLICEGETDTMMAAQLNYQAVGIPGADSFKEKWVDIFSGYEKIIYVADADAVGMKGAEKISRLFLPRKLLVLHLPDGADLCSFVTEYGEESFHKILDEAKELEIDLNVSDSSECNVAFLQPNSPKIERIVILCLMTRFELVETIVNRLKGHHFIDPLFHDAFKLFQAISGATPERVLELLGETYADSALARLRESPISELTFDMLEKNMCILEELHIRRSIVSGAKKLQSDALSHKVKLVDISSGISLLHQTSVDGSSKIQIISSSDLRKTRDELIEKESVDSFWKTGYSRLDDMLTKGISPMLSLIAGRPSMGKSTFRANLKYFLCESGATVLDISPEQDFRLEFDRLISMGTRISARAVARYSMWSKTDVGRVARINAFVDHAEEKWKWYFVPNKMISWQEVVGIIRQTQMKQKIDVVFIDLFDRLLEVKRASTSNNLHYVIGNILDEILAIIDQEKIHVCLVVQIGRFRPAKAVAGSFRPTLEHLYASSTFEQRADLIMMLYRAAYYDPNIPDSEIEVIVGKQRGGTTGTIKLDFEPSTLRISNPV